MQSAHLLKCALRFGSLEEDLQCRRQKFGAAVQFPRQISFLQHDLNQQHEHCKDQTEAEYGLRDPIEECDRWIQT